MLFLSKKKNHILTKTRSKENSFLWYCGQWACTRCAKLPSYQKSASKAREKLWKYIDLWFGIGAITV